MKFCINKGMTNVQLQTDSLVLKQMVTREWRIPWELIDIIEDIHSILQNIHVEIVHI